MKVKILKEEGYDLALRGMAYSYMDRALDVDAWWDSQREKAVKRAELLSSKDGGHNSFLETITVWMDIEAPRCWWSEMDRYRVGKTQLSQSTMHTLSKRAPTYDDFEQGTHSVVIEAFIDVWHEAKGDITTLKMNLPEGFLQRRMVTLNYKVLRNIIAQREGHRLKQWAIFIDEVRRQVQHPEFLT